MKLVYRQTVDGYIGYYNLQNTRMARIIFTADHHFIEISHRISMKICPIETRFFTSERSAEQALLTFLLAEGYRIVSPQQMVMI